MARHRLLDFNNELLTCIAGHLELEDLKNLSQVCHRLAVVCHSDAVWKEMLINKFGVGYKMAKESWKEMYTRKHDDPQHNRICPHLSDVNAKCLEPYIQRYHQVLNWLPKNLNCRTCGQNQQDAGLCLYIWQGNTRLRCRDCAYRYHASIPGRHGIMFRMNVLQMYCFTCSRLLGESRGDQSEAEYVDHLLEIITRDSELGRGAMERRKQCMDERQLYAHDCDRLSVLTSGQYFFVDRMWICSWFLRLCDGKVGVGPIDNTALADENGRLNPSARPRGAFSGGFSIVTPELWNYLVETYGLLGPAFGAEDAQGPAYDELHKAIDNWGLT
ncbi:uncharacterized protein BYT42DRAFT_533320 [Radiomyces spectabilis]|uniref:uncharacterized protein n=1 Tax=Radiomyces spectabilis TaxID=64574 RepID=UPI00221F9B30|nr:uncharacterized protein BYT42DRAFT_533320 [Radiomyces spectabilis]KAI8377708.1 hypothetical protein BYT42DRAFT_533320 [Radiomyces spectabilis]